MEGIGRGRFYAHYALRNLWREGRRSAFALFCVAAGVAAIVALQTLGLSLGEALTGNARAGNRGDVAAILGGLGIANTMVVVVARRRGEIALLKALGLKGRQATAMFVVESALLGLAGSLVGLPLGLGISQGLLRLVAQYVSTPPARHVYSLPLVTGLVVGVAVTVVFGLLPTLMAARVRPARVLQPGDGGLPTSGRGRSLLVVLGLTAVLGLLMGLLLESPAGGLAGAFAALTVLVCLLSLLWVVVWIVERLPSWGWVSLRLAQRGIGRHRARAASTLLALAVGLSLAATLVAAWPASRQRPLEVLRYE